MAECQWHPNRRAVGVCALCLRESLQRLAAFQAEEKSSPDRYGDYSASWKDSKVPGAGKSTRTILMERRGVGKHEAVACQRNDALPLDREPSFFSLDGIELMQGSEETVDRQEEASTSGGSGEAQNCDGETRTGLAKPSHVDSEHRNEVRSSSSSGSKRSTWSVGMFRMGSLRSTWGMLWKSGKRADETAASQLKPIERGNESNGNPAASEAEQQPTPGRHSMASLMDMESRDSKRYSTSSRGSPWSGTSFSFSNANNKSINEDDFSSNWRSSRSIWEAKVSANAPRKGGLEGAAHPPENGGTPHFPFHLDSAAVPNVDNANHNCCYEDQQNARGLQTLSALMAQELKEVRQVSKSSSKGKLRRLFSLSSTTRKIPRKEVRSEAPSKPDKGTCVSGGHVVEDPLKPFQTGQSMSALPRTNSKKSKERPSRSNSMRSPWSGTFSRSRTKPSPVTFSLKAENREEIVMSGDAGFPDDNLPRLSTSSPFVGYFVDSRHLSRSSSNDSSCFATPHWTYRQRP